MDLRRLDDLSFTPVSKSPTTVSLLAQDIEATHARLGLGSPRGLTHLAARPWVVSGEQLGVELRPATICKLAILELLADKGYCPIFLVEDRDVASKAARLRSWALPRSSVHGDAEPVFYASPLNAVTHRTPWKEIPLKNAPFEPNFEQARLHILQSYQALVDGTKRGRLKRVADQLAERMRGFGARTLGEFGQKQVADVARSMGFDKVLFASMGSLEDHWSSTGFAGIFSRYSLDALTSGGLVPADAAIYWGEHLGACSGRVKIRRNGSASCLACKAEVERGGWKPLSLRAGPRMLALRSEGVDLFISGGTSAYNEDIRRFVGASGEAYLPLAWSFELPYTGPHQRVSARVAQETAAGNYSFLDAIVSATVDEAGSASDAEANDPLSSAYRALASRVTTSLEQTGVYFRSGQRRKSSMSFSAVRSCSAPA